MLVCNYCFSKPLSFDFTCKEAQVKKNFERIISVGSSSEISTVIHRSLQYFNASLLYKDVIVDRINTYCFFRLKIKMQ